MLGNLFGPKRPLQGVVNNSVPDSAAAQAAPIQAPAQTTENVIGSSMKPSTRQDLSVLTHLDARMASVLHQAEAETKRIKQSLIEPEQLLFGLFFDGEIFQFLSQVSFNASQASQELQAQEKEGNSLDQPTLSSNTKGILDSAYTIAKNREADFITPEDLLLAFLSSSNSASGFLQSKGLKKDQVEEQLSKSMNFTVGKKSVLDKYGIDLTQEAREGKLDPIVGRDKEVERMVHILLRRLKNNPIIIGDAGVGKTAIVEGLAQSIVKGSAPKDLSQKRIIQLDVSSLVAGASHRGEFEERLRNVIKEVQLSSGQIVLFIDEIHNLIGAGDSEGTMDASNIIKPFLARGQLQVIGTTTTAEYRRYFEKDKAFERRFQPILVDEPSEETAVEMLNTLKTKYENYHKVVITDDAVKSAVHLSKKYIGERFLPDKAVDLLDEASAEVRLSVSEGKRQDNNLNASDIEKIVSRWTGIPITKLTENESEKLLHLEDMIHKRLINQENAVSAISEAVRRGRIGLTNTNRPIASFIFLGPTGVGKTELAKVLAEILFGREEATVRLDMSEYMEKHEVAKLIGAPPGYVGYEEGGQLTEAVRLKPYSIVLLDEIEKAHPDVFNILLQLLEDGRLTDNKGNTISFKNTIIIATSNIGSTLIQQQLLANSEALVAAPVKEEKAEGKLGELSKVLMGELRKFFKPELLNRFDEIVIFEPLTQENMLLIAKISIEKTRKLLLEQNIDLEISQKALEELAKEGYDPMYGARPLRRLIQTVIENPIALLIIQKNFVANDVIVVDYDLNSQQFTFNKKAQSQQPNADEQQVNPQDNHQVNPAVNPATNGQSANGQNNQIAQPVLNPDLNVSTAVVPTPPSEPVSSAGATA